MSDIKRPRMLVLSGLFFNAQGNQSMYNSIKGYQKEYDVTILTVADLSSRTYLTVTDAKARVAGIRVISLWPTWSLNAARKLLGFFKSSDKETKASEDADSPLATFSNTPASRTTQIAFKIRSYILAISGIICALALRPSVICAYEINGLRATSVIKTLFPSILLFGKFQGTIIGPFSDRNEFEQIVSDNYPLEAWSMPFARRLDCAIMTNDGTNGDNLLQRYGISPERILFIPNGVDQRVIDERSKFREQREKQRADPAHQDKEITIASVSRLANWKRVPKVIGAVDDAITRGAKIRHIVIGGGSDDEISAVKEAIQNSRNASKIHFIGALDFEGVISELLQVDVLVSAFAKTNICNPTFEALALGIPVLTIEDSRLVSVIGEKSQACYFFPDDGRSDIEAKLSIELRALRITDIDKRSDFLFTQPSFNWEDRNKAELAFIRGYR